jgi:hypothetical protein
MDKKCCENCDKCACCHGGHRMMMDCCKEHAMSKEHLEMKKKMLEEKLKWVNEELGKSK